MPKYYLYKGKKVKLIRMTYVSHDQRYCTIELPTGQPVSVQMRRLTKLEEKMGAPTLKKKKELHYRRGTKEHNCAGCGMFVKDFAVKAIGGRPLRSEPRCMVMGLKDGRAYRITPDHVCDAHRVGTF